RMMPSRVSHGVRRIRSRSLKVPGSLSSALQTTYFTSPGAPRTNVHLRKVGKPAPPMPRRPATSSALRMASPSRFSTKRRPGAVGARLALVDGDLPVGGRAGGGLVGQRLVGGRGPDAVAQLGPRQAPVDVVVDRQPVRSGVALAEARDAVHLDLVGADLVGD